MVYYTRVPNLARIAVYTFVRHTIGIEAAAHSYAQTNHDKVLHAMSRTVNLLTQSSHVTVVANSYGQTQPVAQHCL